MGVLRVLLNKDGGADGIICGTEYCLLFVQDTATVSVEEIKSITMFGALLKLEQILDASVMSLTVCYANTKLFKEKYF